MKKLRGGKYVLASGCVFMVRIAFCLTNEVSNASIESALPLSNPSWINLSQHMGDAWQQPISSIKFGQLAYELQNHQAQFISSLARRQRQKPYVIYSEPRNNLRHKVPLSLLYWKRKISISSSTQIQQFRIKTTTQEPIETNIILFAFAPIRMETYRGTNILLSINQNDTFEEAISPNEKIQTLRINPDDGNGFRTISTNQEVFVSYISTGLKTMTLEASLTNGTTLYASALLDVKALSQPDPTATVVLTASAPYTNTTGTIYIYKSDNHAGLRCPVLVAEGFDMENNMDWDVLYNILNKEQLAETLRSFGRDLIVLDYANATRNIFENAALAQAAIKYVNANRQTFSDKFTVIGASMGGLVTRIALTQMDTDPAKYGESHVNTWISFDSPQKGANIPLGLQEYFAFFKGKTGMPVSISQYYSLLNTMAAKQMLLVHSSTMTTYAGNAAHDTFQNTLDTLGYPFLCKKIAISNGSGYQETQPFSKGQLILNWDNPGWLLADVACRIYAISTSASTIFWGFHDTLAWFDETSTTQTHYYPYALDNAPGGYRNSFQILFNEIVASGNSGSSDFCVANNHCFIPACSSIGLDIAYCNAFLYYAGIIYPTPFDEIHFASANEPHIDINLNNKRWFIRAVLENYDTDKDGFDDYYEYLSGTVYDSPKSKLLMNTSFSTQPESDYFVLNWNKTPNTIYYIYYTESLSSPWSLQDSGDASHFTSPLYHFKDPEKPSGFYKIQAVILDPVSD